MRCPTLAILLLPALLQVSACVETPYTEPSEMLYPGPCSTEDRTFIYDEHHRITEVRDASGEVLERYNYRTDDDFDVEFYREIGYDPSNSSENINDVVLLNVKLNAHVQINPNTFEMRVLSIDGTLPPPYEGGSGTIEYAYEESDDGWLTSMRATAPTGWRFLDQPFNAWGDYREERPSRRTSFGVKWVDASWYEEWSGETVDRDKVLSISYNNGAFSSDICYYGDRYIHINPITTLDGAFHVGKFGIQSSRTNEINNKYDNYGNLINSSSLANVSERPTGHTYTYGYACWTSEQEQCSNWRYIHSDSYSAFVSISAEKRHLWLDLFEVVRIPCEWSWTVAAHLP